MLDEKDRKFISEWMKELRTQMTAIFGVVLFIAVDSAVHTCAKPAAAEDSADTQGWVLELLDDGNSTMHMTTYIPCDPAKLVEAIEYLLPGERITTYPINLPESEQLQRAADSASAREQRIGEIRKLVEECK